MKKYLLIFMMISVMLLISCENPLKHTFEILKGDADYYPLAIGNYWRYSAKISDDYSLHVKEQVTYYDEYAFRVEKKQAGVYSSKYYIPVEAGVKTYIYPSGWIYHVQYPFMKDEGWEFTKGDAIYKFTFDSWDDVETPAGQFKDSAKFFVSISKTIGSVETVVEEYSYWYGKNVGLVKMEQTYALSGDLDLIFLIDYNIVN